MSKLYIPRAPCAARRSLLAAVARLSLVLGALALLAPASSALADSGKHDAMPGMRSGHGAAGCERDVHVTDAAERQMGGALYTGPMPAKGEGGMKMSGMKMGGQSGMKMSGQATMASSGGKGMEMAHQDHEAKEGGVLFMAPNEMHHIEGAYSPQCGFQLYFYNAFTKPIAVQRFQALLKVYGEVNGEEAEIYRFLSPNEHNTALQVALPEGLTGELEIELYVKFPGSPKAELFNFAVDEHGEMS